MRKTVVINIVGLTQKLLKHLPSAQRLGPAATIGHVAPAVTCSVQATYLTGTLPREHGIVGNGWYFRDECEIRFWHQSDKLVQRPRIWEIAKKQNPSFTCANLFWWNAMYSSADVTVTPRPMYPADGRKIPDLWTNPPQLRKILQDTLGPFPLFKFWGPGASIESTQWIAKAAPIVDGLHHPTLTLIYLPHLDYGLQRFGPDDSRVVDELRQLDQVLRGLLDHYRNEPGTRIILLSEYGIEPANRPIHINRILRDQKLLTIRPGLGRDLLDAGASSAFAVADHQVAHVYVNDPAKLEATAKLLRSTPGIAQVLDRPAMQEIGLDHPRSGELLAIAEPGAWFTYYYWLDDSRAPDFARTIDIHRKPGYDPAELFLDPQLIFPKAQVAWMLMKRRLGFATLMNVIPLDATLVRGSHGLAPAEQESSPILISSESSLLDGDSVPPTDVLATILRHVEL